MNRSKWRELRDRAERRSRNAGADKTLVALFEAAGNYHRESGLAPDYRAVDLYLAAWQIQTVIIQYARGTMDRFEANIWVEAAETHLAKIAAERRDR